jgi:hypothetical protein
MLEVSCQSRTRHVIRDNSPIISLRPDVADPVDTSVLVFLSHRPSALDPLVFRLTLLPSRWASSDGAADFFWVRGSLISLFFFAFSVFFHGNAVIKQQFESLLFKGCVPGHSYSKIIGRATLR